MKTTQVVVTKKKVDEYSGELLVGFVGQGDNDEIIGDRIFAPVLKSLRQIGEFSGEKENYLQLYPRLGPLKDRLQSKRLLLIGLGSIGEVLDPGHVHELLRIAGGIVAGQCKKNKVKTVGIKIPELDVFHDSMVGEYVTEGILLGIYQFLKYKKKDKTAYPGLRNITFLGGTNNVAIRKAALRGANSALAACTARDMANEPGNGWTPIHFARYAKRIEKKLELQCTVLEESQMIQLGMGGIIAVNRGSKESPKCVILDYNPAKKSDTILLVGKGLTFDSGGISLKPAQGMMKMKYDMCGGAAVLAAIEAVAREKLGVRLVAIIPSTDNMTGGGAVKPGDIITHYGGITSEIENTDAEGRLILADALAYGIDKFKPDCVIDLATLTGAVVFALGHHYAGLMSNNDSLTKRLVEAGNICGEPLWRLPLGDMYAKQIESKLADIRNVGGKSAGSVTAAEYLHRFVGEVPWAHLDIAGTAWDFTKKSYIPRGPSGFGVRTLIELFRRWENGL